jgi:glycosyltransferase involved in cell wall biosynthesis
MNVVHIIVSLDVGGAELMLKRLIESHRGNPDYQHSVISLQNVGKVGLQLRAMGVVVHGLDLRSALDIPRVLWQLVRMIRSSRVGIVQTWMFHADLLGGIAARLARNRKLIWGIRATEVDARLTRVVRWLCAKLSGVVPHTIVCAAEVSRRAHIALGYDASRMVVVPNGFDLTRLIATPEQREKLRTRCGFNAETMVVGYLGRFNLLKDQKNFVQAAGLVVQKHSNVHFLMVGSDLDTDNALLMEWITKTGYADHFVLLGERDDVPVCLAAMDLFCLSSRAEGFPNVVGEAMAMGVPCVVTDVGDAAMLVADTGIVVPKENSDALAQGLEHLLAMPSNTRQQLGQKAKKRIQTEFTMERACERFESIYQQLTKSESI